MSSIPSGSPRKLEICLKNRTMDFTSQALTHQEMTYINKELLAKYYNTNNLIFENNNLGDEGETLLEIIQRVHLVLTHINLASTNLSPNTVISLLEHDCLNRERIVYLNLNNINLSSSILLSPALKIAQFIQESHLTELYLNQCQLGSEEITMIANAIINNASITTLDLGRNKIEQEGAEQFKKL